MTNSSSHFVPPPFFVETNEDVIQSMGNINSKLHTNVRTNKSYVILNYDKTMVCDDDLTRGVYNSVIVNPSNRQIFAIGPSKPRSFLSFCEQYSLDQDISDLYVNELIEGTQIQLFFDKQTNCWEIATRNAVGGNYIFYREPKKLSPTFLQMVMEAFQESPDADLNSLAFLRNFSPQNCYHFVLQHPSNRLVQNILFPKMYLIGVHQILGGNIQFIPPTEYERWEVFPNIIHFPKNYTNSIIYRENQNVYQEYVDTFASIQCSPTQYMGIVFTNVKSGERSIVVNPQYESMQVMRGNAPNIQYHYLCLKKTKKEKEFVQMFPFYKKMFNEFHQEFERLVQHIHQSYFIHYIQKSDETVSPKYLSHIKQIHESIYIPSLLSQKVIVRKEVVRNYLLDLSPASILHIWNYYIRE
jgi:hypothetical protein